MALNALKQRTCSEASTSGLAAPSGRSLLIGRVPSSAVCHLHTGRGRHRGGPGCRALVINVLNAGAERFKDEDDYPPERPTSFELAQRPDKQKPLVRVRLSVHYRVHSRQMLCIGGSQIPFGWSFLSIAKVPMTWNNGDTWTCEVRRAPSSAGWDAASAYIRKPQAARGHSFNRPATTCSQSWHAGRAPSGPADRVQVCHPRRAGGAMGGRACGAAARGDDVGRSPQARRLTGSLFCLPLVAPCARTHANKWPQPALCTRGAAGLDQARKRRRTGAGGDHLPHCCRSGETA